MKRKILFSFASAFVCVCVSRFHSSLFLSGFCSQMHAFDAEENVFFRRCRRQQRRRRDGVCVCVCVFVWRKSSRKSQNKNPYWHEDCRRNSSDSRRQQHTSCVRVVRNRMVATVSRELLISPWSAQTEMKWNELCVCELRKLSTFAVECAWARDTSQEEKITCVHVIELLVLLFKIMPRHTPYGILRTIVERESAESIRIILYIVFFSLVFLLSPFYYDLRWTVGVWACVFRTQPKLTLQPNIMQLFLIQSIFVCQLSFDKYHVDLHRLLLKILLLFPITMTDEKL